jgi:glyoxylase-like metal-dependent hydrolase (beta-lactamase superfamily II)
VAADHLCYLLEDDRILLSGDLVRGDDCGDLAPPADLDAAGWLASIERLAKLRPPLRAIGPGHGHFVDDPKAALAQELRAA